ncbi:HugZ family protein [Thermithiobacillus plumbiphilus]|uniref:DUF2470 domain-containing protein n=1 Tax=Thermithiobacillus plumbiphilus TaxID=1729899 RepID=A0ABU9D6I3_9PROT
MNPSENPAGQARQIVRSHAVGALSTLSVAMEGFPFGSVATYVLDHQAQPVFLLSDLAQHSRNIKHDPRSSLLVLESGAEEGVLARGRVTLVGETSVFEPDAHLRARYLRYFPEAAGFMETHDFRFYRMDVARVRFIGGFGRIHWIEGAAYQATMLDELAAAEAGALAHMNADHQQALRDYCRFYHGIEASGEVRMLGIDAEGFDLLCKGRRLRCQFPAPIQAAGEMRGVLVEMARTARQDAEG